MIPCKSISEEVSFEWSDYRISSTDSKVTATPGGGGGGGGLGPLCQLYMYVCAAPKGMVFEPFWSENGYRFLTIMV